MDATILDEEKEVVAFALAELSRRKFTIPDWEIKSLEQLLYWYSGPAAAYLTDEQALSVLLSSKYPHFWLAPAAEGGSEGFSVMWRRELTSEEQEEIRAGNEKLEDRVEVSPGFEQALLQTSWYKPAAHRSPATHVTEQADSTMFASLIEQFRIPIPQELPIVKLPDCVNHYFDDGKPPYKYDEEGQRYCFSSVEAPLLLKLGYNPYSGRRLRSAFIDSLLDIEYGNYNSCTELEGAVRLPQLSGESQKWIRDWVGGSHFYREGKHVRIPVTVRRELLPYRPCGQLTLCRGVLFRDGYLKEHEPFYVGKSIPLSLGVPSSWSTKRSVCEKFSTGGIGGIVLEITAVSKDMLVDFASIGMDGPESEVIMMPGTYTATVVSIYKGHSDMIDN
jgi:hypothetical protein